MNFVLFLGALALAATVIVVALTYLMQPKTRARFPGGRRRYLLAVVAQAGAFILPMPFVLLALFGRAPAGLDVIIAFLISLALVVLLRYAPFIGPLLKDLSRARLETALERLAEKPDAP